MLNIHIYNIINILLILLATTYIKKCTYFERFIRRCIIRWKRVEHLSIFRFINKKQIGNNQCYDIVPHFEGHINKTFTLYYVIGQRGQQRHFAPQKKIHTHMNIYGTYI